MPTEQEKRLHRCCFAGHRPESIALSEEAAKEWLREQIRKSIEDGFCTFITGMGMGVDIWAAQIVSELKRESDSLHLIAVVPYPAFSAKWSEAWAASYHQVIREADLVKQISTRYTPDALTERNRWMADHAARLIGIYNGTEGHTGHLIKYAGQQGLEMCLYPFPKVTAEPAAVSRGYPLNLLDSVMACEAFQASRPVEMSDLPPDFDQRLALAVSLLPDERAGEFLYCRFRDNNTLQAIGDNAGLSRERVRQLIEKYIKRLRQPDILRHLNCGIENIPEKSSQAMLRRIEEKLNGE